MHPVIDQKRGEISGICRRLGIRKLEVFGSAARDEDREDSDLDLLVDALPGTT